MRPEVHVHILVWVTSTSGLGLSPKLAGPYFPLVCIHTHTRAHVKVPDVERNGEKHVNVNLGKTRSTLDWPPYVAPLHYSSSSFAFQGL